MKFKFRIKQEDVFTFSEYERVFDTNAIKVQDIEIVVEFGPVNTFTCDFGSRITHEKLVNSDSIYNSIVKYVKNKLFEERVKLKNNEKRREAEEKAIINLFNSASEKSKEENIKKEMDKFLNMFGPMFAPTAKTAVNKPIDKTKVSSVNKPIDKTKVSSKDTYFEDLVDKINKDSLNLVGKENKKETKHFFEKGVEKIINDFLEEFDLKGNKEDKPFSVEDWK